MKFNLAKQVRLVNRAVSNNSPTILIFLGIIGAGTTIVMACKSTPLAIDRLNELHEKQEELDDLSRSKQMLEDFKVAVPVYIPSIIMGGLSVACIIGSYKISAKRCYALATAYSISETTLREYQKKVIEKIGEKKETEIRDAIAKDHIRDNPPKNLRRGSSGTAKFRDSVTGMWFYCDKETILHAESKLNKMLFLEDFIRLNDFYYEIGIGNTPAGDLLGWKQGDEIEFYFSCCMDEDGEPCSELRYRTIPNYPIEYQTCHLM